MAKSVWTFGQGTPRKGERDKLGDLHSDLTIVHKWGQKSGTPPPKSNDPQLFGQSADLFLVWFFWECTTDPQKTRCKKNTNKNTTQKRQVAWKFFQDLARGCAGEDFSIVKIFTSSGDFFILQHHVSGNIVHILDNLSIFPQESMKATKISKNATFAKKKSE